MRETFVAIAVALMLLYVLTKTETGRKLFFTVKGSAASSDAPASTAGSAAGAVGNFAGLFDWGSPSVLNTEAQ